MASRAKELMSHEISNILSSHCLSNFKGCGIPRSPCEDKGVVTQSFFWWGGYALLLQSFRLLRSEEQRHALGPVAASFTIFFKFFQIQTPFQHALYFLFFIFYTHHFILLLLFFFKNLLFLPFCPGDSKKNIFFDLNYLYFIFFFFWADLTFYSLLLFCEWRTCLFVVSCCWLSMFYILVCIWYWL